MWHAVRMRARPSALVLIAANLIPLAGVVWLGWSAMEILLLYWTESVIIGAINVLRMAFAAPAAQAAGGEAQPDGGSTEPPVGVSKLFLIPFFVAHFGMFCFGHLSAVVFLVGAARADGNLLAALPPTSDQLFWLAVAAIGLSHLFSFFFNYLGTGEFRRTNLAELMKRPYDRIVVMHIAIVGGAVLVEKLSSPLPLLLLLIAVKTAFDVKLHLRERRALGTDSTEDLIVTTSGKGI